MYAAKPASHSPVEGSDRADDVIGAMDMDLGQSPLIVLASAQAT